MNMRKISFGLAVLTVFTSLEAHALCPLPPGNGCQDLSSKPVPPGNLDGVSPLRKSIISSAMSQIGQVSALAGDDGNKCGWERLTSFYDTSYEKPLRHKDYQTLKRPMSITTVPDPENPGQLKAVVNQNKVNEWCGIFALWAVKTGARSFSAGKPPLCGGTVTGTDSTDVSTVSGLYPEFAVWKPRNGSWGIDGLPFTYGRKGIQPGDVVYFKGDLRHQAIVERIVGDRIYTIDGNQECGTIGRKDRPLSAVGGYYRVE